MIVFKRVILPAAALGIGWILFYYWPKALLAYLLIFFVMSCFIFGIFQGCKKDWEEKIIEEHEKERKLSDGVFQRIKVMNSKDVYFNVTNPVIDYSEDENFPDEESFGIRIKNESDTETILWDNIDRIDIIKKDKAYLTAKIKLTNSDILDVDLVEDSQGGLSGTNNSQPFQIRLGNIKSIHVILSISITYSRPPFIKWFTCFIKSVINIFFFFRE